MPKGKKNNYDPNILNLALRQIRETGKIREIARKYGIPKSTLHFKMKNPGHKTSFGPPPVLTEAEEKTLEFWIKEVMRKGFPLKVEDLKQSVYKFLVENPRPNKFKNNYPGDGWVRGFLKRHPAIVQRTSEGVTQSSACVSESDIRKWFSEIQTYLSENNLLHILNDPTRVYNGDESGFQLCPKTGKVLAVKGTKNVYNIDTNNAKESITVMFTFSAAGDACPPMVVYNYQRIPQKIAERVPHEWGIGRSENGWMTSELFFEYIANIFHPYLLRRGVILPVVYFLDGHKSHLTYSISKLCKQLGIEVIALYPNATRILQPADVAVFRPVKAAWKDATRLWHLENQGDPITKVNFASILDIALKKSIKPETLVNGFRTCGLVPFDPNAIDYSKCLGSTNNDVVVNTPPDLEQSNLSSQYVLKFSQFSEIVGPSKLTELKTYDYKNAPVADENLKILYQLYSVFNVNSSEFDSSHMNISTTDNLNIVSQPPNGLQTIDEIDFHELIPKEPQIDGPEVSPRVDDCFDKGPVTSNSCQLEAPPIDISRNDNLNNIRLELSNISLTNNEGFDPQPISNSAEINATQTSLSRATDHLNIDPVTGPVSANKKITVISELHFQIPKDVTPVKQVISSNSLSPNTSQTFQKGYNISNNSPAFKVVSNSLLGKFLTLPKTPERKGKRNTVKLPFAITSAKYRAMIQEQNLKKELELKAKEEKKKAREETKQKIAIDKQEKENKRKNKKIQEVSNSCKICLKSTKTSNRLTCDMCSTIFHVKCVPAKHQEHVPIDITVDLFICHNCYKEDNNDDLDDMSTEINSEVNTDDEGFDTEDLYNMVKENMTYKRF